jgi:hypothetical protein
MLFVSNPVSLERVQFFPVSLVEATSVATGGQTECVVRSRATETCQKLLNEKDDEAAAPSFLLHKNKHQLLCRSLLVATRKMEETHKLESTRRDCQRCTDPRLLSMKWCCGWQKKIQKTRSLRFRLFATKKRPTDTSVAIPSTMTGWLNATTARTMNSNNKNNNSSSSISYLFVRVENEKVDGKDQTMRAFLSGNES